MTHADPAPHAVLALQVADSRQDVADVLGVAGVARGIVWRAGVCGVCGVWREPVV